jgi:hypothetical protein
MADALEELEAELVKYTGFRRKYGEPDYTFAQGLIEHRRQALLNMRDDRDPMWLTRNGLLEKLADRKGIDLSSEPSVNDMLDDRQQRLAQ